MQTVPNQKILTIHKYRKDDELYTSYSQLAQQRMMNDLNKIGSIKLWLYLCKNQDAYTFALSSADAAQWGIKSDAYKAGVKDLIDKGYLVPTGEGNHYLFYDIPPAGSKNRQQEMEANRKRLDDFLDNSSDYFGLQRVQKLRIS